MFNVCLYTIGTHKFVMVAAKGLATAEAATAYVSALHLPGFYGVICGG